MYSLWNVPWCFGGDFNVTRFPSERSIEAHFSNTMSDFSDLIFELNLIDFLLVGGNFTWPNGHSWSRLDRFLVSDTFSALILKKMGAVYMKDFWPISLLNGVYNIISNILANHMCVVMDNIIMKSQNAFVKGRQIPNSVLIANECPDSRINSKDPGILCKLDVEKAYDHVN